MTMRVAAVIGAGVIGMCCARALQREGFAVRVIDRLEPGRNCSYGNAGHLAIDHVTPLAQPHILRRAPKFLFDPLGPLAVRWSALPSHLGWFLRFALATRRAQVQRGTAALTLLDAHATETWRAELAAAGGSGLLRTNGSMVACERKESLAGQELDVRRACGVKLEVIDGAEARRLAPGLSPAIQAAILFPECSHVLNPYRVVTTLADAFVRDGGRIDRDEVVGFDRKAGAVTAVATRGGSVPADLVVLAGGSQTHALARMVDARVPVTAERGYHLMVKDAAIDLALPVSSAERSFVLTPMEMGIRLAGTVEFAGETAPPNWRRATLLHDHARALFPDLGGSEESRWFGNRPALPDYVPAIGPLPDLPNAIVATGHQHLGLTFAAVTGRMVAAMAGGRRDPAWHPALDPGRFA